MKDALSVVRQFTSEGNLSRNGNLRTTTMKEMWDYESQKPFSGKTRDVSEVVPEKPKNWQAKPKIECELCGGNHKVEQCPHERKFSLGMDTTSSDTKDKFPNGKSKSVDYFKPQWKQPSIWRPVKSVNGRKNLMVYHHTRDRLTPENLLELDPRKDQLGMGCRQILPDPKTKAWVDEQNRINTEKTLGYDKPYEEARDTMHPDPQIDVKPLVKSPKKGTVVASEKEKDTPQLSCALQEFVKHIADSLVDKGWNLHLKFGEREPQGEQFIQGSSPWEPTAKTDKKEKVSKPQISRQIPLEMGTGGGGGGGKKGGSGGKKPPEDKVEIEGHSSENEEDDSSLETSLELNIDPQQLASVRLDRPLLRLRLTPRQRIIGTAPGGGGTPPPLGGGTVTVQFHERQNGTRSNQPIEGGGGLPQPPDGGGGGTGPLLPERGRRTPQQPVGGGGAPPPGGHGGGNGNGDDHGGGGRLPPPRGNGGNGSDGGDDGDGGGGDDLPPLSDHRQP